MLCRVVSRSVSACCSRELGASGVLWGAPSRGLRSSAAVEAAAGAWGSRVPSGRRVGRAGGQSLGEKASIGGDIQDWGTKGELLVDFDRAALDRKLAAHAPSIDTLKQEFFGIPYDQIPICTIRCSKNNTKMGFTTAAGEDICYTSCSQEGFKNAKKKTMVAGQATGVAAAVRALRRGVTTVRVVVRGLGPGRMSSVKGLALGGLNVVSITDNTPLIEMGPRMQKIRRL